MSLSLSLSQVSRRCASAQDAALRDTYTLNLELMKQECINMFKRLYEREPNEEELFDMFTEGKMTVGAFVWRVPKSRIFQNRTHVFFPVFDFFVKTFRQIPLLTFFWEKICVLLCVPVHMHPQRDWTHACLSGVKINKRPFPLRTPCFSISIFSS